MPASAAPGVLDASRLRHGGLSVMLYADAAGETARLRAARARSIGNATNWNCGLRFRSRTSRPALPQAKPSPVLGQHRCDPGASPAPKMLGSARWTRNSVKLSRAAPRLAWLAQANLNWIKGPRRLRQGNALADAQASPQQRFSRAARAAIGSPQGNFVPAMTTSSPTTISGAPVAAQLAVFSPRRLQELSRCRIQHTGCHWRRRTGESACSSRTTRSRKGAPQADSGRPFAATAACCNGRPNQRQQQGRQDIGSHGPKPRRSAHRQTKLARPSGNGALPALS